MMMIGREMKKQTVVSSAESTTEEDGGVGIVGSRILAVPGEITLWYIRPSWEYYLTCKDMWGSVPEEVRCWLKSEEKELNGSTCESVMRWFLNQECVPTDKELNSMAAEGRLDILEMCKESKVELNGELCWVAASKGHVNVLQWLYENEENEAWSNSAVMSCNNEHTRDVLWLTTTPWSMSANMACMNGHLEVLEWLKGLEMEFDTESCKKFAASGGHVDLLVWLNANAKKDVWTGAVFDSAVRGGQLELMKWLVSMGFNIDVHGSRKRRDYALSAACKGHVDVLEWLRWEGWCADSNLEHEMMNICVGGLHFDALKFLYAEGFKISRYVFDDFIEEVVRAGLFEMLEFLRLKEVQFCARSVCEVAAETGRLDILKMFKWVDWTQDVDSVCGILDACICGVQFEVLKFLVEEEGFSLERVESDSVAAVIRQGHIEMLEFLRSNGFIIGTRDSCVCAAGAGQLEVLTMLKCESLTSDYDFMSDMLNSCVRGVHFEMLKFLVAEGHFEVLKCFDARGFKVKCLCGRSIDNVIKKGNLEMLKFLYSMRVEFHAESLCASAAFCGKLHVLKWLLSDVVSTPCVDNLKLQVSLTENASSGGRMKVLKFLDDRGLLSKDSARAFAKAANYGRLDVLKFLDLKGFKFDFRECSQIAQSQGHVNVHVWCRSRLYVQIKFVDVCA